MVGFGCTKKKKRMVRTRCLTNCLDRIPKMNISSSNLSTMKLHQSMVCRFFSRIDYELVEFPFIPYHRHVQQPIETSDDGQTFGQYLDRISHESSVQKPI